jgi:hypothetical protein
VPITNRRPRRFQARVKGGREGLSAAVLESIKHALTKTANQHGVSRSWVVSVIVADFYGIAVEHWDKKE